MQATARCQNPKVECEESHEGITYEHHAIIIDSSANLRAPSKRFNARRSMAPEKVWREKAHPSLDEL